MLDLGPILDKIPVHSITKISGGACPSIHPDLAASMAYFFSLEKQSKSGQNCASPCLPRYVGLEKYQKFRFLNVPMVQTDNLLNKEYC